MKQFMKQMIGAGVVSAMLALPGSAALANEQPFDQWVAAFKTEAMAQGISSAVLDEAFAGVVPDDRVITLDRKQPESTMSFAQYLERVVNQQRIKQGQRLYQQHRHLLDEIGAAYGVQPRFIVALWGIETNFGGNTGGFSIIEALATLAYDGRRSEFFRGELMHAFKILQDGHISLYEFQGSWAGAMGQTQFMPSSFLNFAVDYNGDGRKDIWKTLPDVFASIANYLKNTGWEYDVTWGRKVSVPKGFDVSQASMEIEKPLTEWQKLGVREFGGAALPNRPEIMASLVFPGDNNGPAYLAYGNYKRILKWNRSKFFATAVGTLADRIGAGK